jgi:hypothetical protein
VRFARIVFIVGGIWGIAVLAPLFFLRDITGLAYTPPATYPHFFYGFLTTAMAWQIAFLIIGSNPAKFRLLIIPAILEKWGYVLSVAMLHGNGRVSSSEAGTAVPDLLLGLLFIVAFVTTRPGIAAQQQGNTASGTAR